MKKLLIATISGMIEKEEVKDLESFCDIDWIVKEKIEDIEHLDNVILAPTNAWYSDESMENLKNIWINNIVEYEKGNIINLVEE